MVHGPMMHLTTASLDDPIRKWVAAGLTGGPTCRSVLPEGNGR